MQAQVDATPTRASGAGVAGAATGESASLVYSREGEPTVGALTALLPDGRRAIAKTTDPGDLAALSEAPVDRPRGRSWTARAACSSDGRAATPGAPACLQGHDPPTAPPRPHPARLRGRARRPGERRQPAPPAATSGAATSVTLTGATLTATVDPQGASTSYHFDYGTSDSYGLTHERP